VKNILRLIKKRTTLLSLAFFSLASLMIATTVRGAQVSTSISFTGFKLGVPYCQGFSVTIAISGETRTPRSLKTQPPQERGLTDPYFISHIEIFDPTGTPWPDYLTIGFYDWTDIEQDTDLTYVSGKLYVIEITFSGRVVKRTNNNYYIDVEMYLYLDSYGKDDHLISYSNHLDGTWTFE